MKNQRGACLVGDGLRFRSAELATVTLLRLDERLRSFFPSVSLPCSINGYERPRSTSTIACTSKHLLRALCRTSETMYAM